MSRSLSTIAAEITADYRAQGKPVHFSAVPYVQAMYGLNSLTDHFGYDDGRTVVLYALSNLTTWRGDTARRVKAELKAMLAAK